jgi:hypothetical protein
MRTDARFLEAVEGATQAFFAALAASYPEVTTGDFPIDRTFGHRFEEAADVWLDINWPEPTTEVRTDQQ